MSQVDTGAAVNPRYVRVHADDNVAIVVNDGGLPAGAQFAGGLALLERVPQAHKIALRDIGAGGAVVRYGQAIGYATRPLAAGSWVREDMIALPDPPALDRLPLATAPPPAPEPLHGYEFEG